MIQHAFSMPRLVNLISKDAFIRLQATSDYDVIVDFLVDWMSLTTSFKKCNVMMT